MAHLKNYIGPVFRWLRRLCLWVVQAWLVIFAVSVVAVAIWLSVYFGTEQSIRFSGLALELLGLSAAAVGIRDTRRSFGKPSFLGLIRNWFKAIPGLRPHATMIAGSGSFSVSSFGRANLWRGAGPDPTVESRLDIAEANLKQLYDRANIAESEFDAHVRQAARSLQDEANLRKEGDRQLSIKIESVSTDGLHLAAVGAFWLAFGVVLSTASSELFVLIR